MTSSMLRAGGRGGPLRAGRRGLVRHSTSTLDGLTLELDGHDGDRLRAAVGAGEVHEPELLAPGEEADVPLAVGLPAGRAGEGGQFARQPALGIHAPSVEPPMRPGCEPAAGRTRVPRMLLERSRGATRECQVGVAGPSRAWYTDATQTHTEGMFVRWAPRGEPSPSAQQPCSSSVWRPLPPPRTPARLPMPARPRPMVSWPASWRQASSACPPTRPIRRSRSWTPTAP